MDSENEPYQRPISRRRDGVHLGAVGMQTELIQVHGGNSVIFRDSQALGYTLTLVPKLSSRLGCSEASLGAAQRAKGVPNVIPNPLAKVAR
jgi:hypothetical protein